MNSGNANIILRDKSIAKI